MDIKNQFRKYQDNIIEDLQGLIKIPSIAGESEENYPFGKAVQDALVYMLDLGASMGFEIKNVDNYGGHIDFPGSEEGLMAIVCHLDVVPEGEGWTRDPFGGQVVDGWMYGRGVQDDKGAAIIGLYAMKTLKDMGFQPKKTIRLILGLDEETNWEGMDYYLKKERAPDFGIVPDADFPLIQCERGLLEFDLVKKHARPFSEDSGCVLYSLSGGVAPNVVPGDAEFCLRGTEQGLSDAKAYFDKRICDKSYDCDAVVEGGALLMKVKGQPAHAAYPERGRNAISIAMDLLDGFAFDNEEANELVRFYNSSIGFNLHGDRIGCGLSDDLSGKMTFNVGKIAFDEVEVRITIDARYPVTKDKADLYEGMKPVIEPKGFHIEELDHIPAIYQEPENPFVKTLIGIYREISGDYETEPRIIGGATFARAIPNCLAFGPLFPGDIESEHQKDERVQLSQLYKAGYIYAEALYRLTK